VTRSRTLPLRTGYPVTSFTNVAETNTGIEESREETWVSLR
jgi:hypothetical protein